MAILPILHFPDPRLRTIAKPVEQVDDEIRQLAADMQETMYEAQGIGLAATQVNVHKRLVVLDVSEERDQPLVLINPKVTTFNDDEKELHEEGCLSVPGFYEEVERPTQVEVSAVDENGKPFTLKPDGLLAVCIQHELDHLNGKLFVDYLSRSKRSLIRSKLLKAQ